MACQDGFFSAVMTRGCGYLVRLSVVGGSSGTLAGLISGDLNSTKEETDGPGYPAVIHQERRMLPFNLNPDLSLCVPCHTSTHTHTHRHTRVLEGGSVCLRVCVLACSLMKCISSRNRSRVIRSHHATNGVRPSHLPVTLALGQCHNNCL